MSASHEHKGGIPEYPEIKEDVKPCIPNSSNYGIAESEIAEPDDSKLKAPEDYSNASASPPSQRIGMISLQSDEPQSIDMDLDKIGGAEGKSLASPDNSTRSSTASWPFPLDNDLMVYLLDMLPRQALWAFASTSRMSYHVSLPVLYRKIKLPFPESAEDFGVTQGADLREHIRTVTIDLSDDAFYETNYPGDLMIRKTLHNLTHLQHLVVRKSTHLASDAVLGSLLRYLVEQSDLQELTIDWNFNHRMVDIIPFHAKLTRSWPTVHREAFHTKPRQLTSLNLTIHNELGTNDGFRGIKELWNLLLTTVKTIKLDISRVGYTGSFTNPYLPKWTDYMKLLSGRLVENLDITLAKVASRPYSEIATLFPRLKQLKIRIEGAGRDRKLTELVSLGRLMQLVALDLPWAYDTTRPHEPGVTRICNKAKDKAKKVVSAIAPSDIREEKQLKSCIRKFTTATLQNHRLRKLREITWRYHLESGDEELATKYNVKWEGGEPILLEMSVSGEVFSQEGSSSGDSS
ncbi:hypothetical protein ABW19_dt0203881 [Dactylella cylindrospora]|nr:hypothetical protein ABW19_dt0203881 [Dactylella cylindrospora]